MSFLISVLAVTPVIFFRRPGRVFHGQPPEKDKAEKTGDGNDIFPALGISDEFD
jgi:hypothetical protein